MNENTLTIGRYEIQRVLGRGAMGVVYLAQDPGLKRLVAIKVVQSSGEDHSVTLERFQREAEISAKLSHPNIVMVFDVGDDPAAGPFLAMEYVEGVSLADLIETGLSPETALFLLVQGMHALQAAEAAGIAHRDIKPDNVLVSKDGRFKLMDFGIARRDESRLTQTGMIFGTPAYTAPELLVGAEASPVTDSYAFTVTAFEMLTGTVPYQGTSVANTLYRIVHDPPSMPENLDESLRQVFCKAFAKTPEERYPSLRHFMKALIEATQLPEEFRLRLLAYVEDHTNLVGVTSFSSPTLDLSHQGRKGATVRTLNANDTRSSKIKPRWMELPKPTWSWYRPWMLLAAVASLTLLVSGITSTMLWTWGKKAHRIDIASTPAGANVLLNGRYIGKTPLYKVSVQDKGNILRLELSGHQPLTRTIDPGEWSIHVILVKPPFNIPVETDPSDAEVFLNGRSVGKTPIDSLAVPREGRQELKIRKKDYYEWSALIDENMPFPSPIVLNPSGYTVRVITKPSGAKVFLDDHLVGTTPLESLDVSGLGSMNLILERDGYATWHGKIQRGKPLPEPIVLKRQR